MNEKIKKTIEILKIISFPGILFISLILYGFFDQAELILLISILIIFIAIYPYVKLWQNKIKKIHQSAYDGENKIIKNLIKNENSKKINLYLIIWLIILLIILGFIILITYLFLIFFAISFIFLYQKQILLGITAIIFSLIFLYPGFVFLFDILPKLVPRYYLFLIYYLGFLKKAKVKNFNIKINDFIFFIKKTSAELNLTKDEKEVFAFLGFYLKQIFYMPLNIEQKHFIINKLKNPIIEKKYNQINYQIIEIDKYLNKNQKERYNFLKENLKNDYALETPINSFNSNKFISELKYNFINKKNKKPILNYCNKFFYFYLKHYKTNLILTLLFVYLIAYYWFDFRIPQEISLLAQTLARIFD